MIDVRIPTEPVGDFVKASQDESDPVGRFGESDWGFWSETWTDWHGGHADEAAARAALTLYCAHMEQGNDVSSGDAFAQKQGFTDAQELEACREASLSLSLAAADHRPSAPSPTPVAFVGDEAEKTAR